ncbi:MAG: Dipeptidyl aminopeptidase/acylaminoacyl-peptidase-like protein [Bacteroidetes bacterium]|jgi:hypothetical protein|nr:Dipeptidyl aminopeptidase/acylaminoacyl-peptidase-like protein [Bacteroidota bacterium]
MKSYILFILVGSGLLFFACVNDTVREQKKPIDIQKFLEKQALLTNEACFSGERFLYGESAFLLRIGKQVYAVTARNLIEEEGGIEPPIEAENLEKELVEWKMYPRVPIDSLSDTVIVSVNGLDYSALNRKFDYSELKRDILLFRVMNDNSNLKILEPSGRPPELNERCFVVGCPYE